MNNPVQFMQMMRNPEMQQKIMNNPQFQQQFQQKLRSMDPSVELDKIASNPKVMNNPIVKNVMAMRNNNDTDGLTKFAENAFSEKGQNYSEFEQEAKQFLGFN